MLTYSLLPCTSCWYSAVLWIYNDCMAFIWCLRSQKMKLQTWMSDSLLPTVESAWLMFVRVGWNKHRDAMLLEVTLIDLTSHFYKRCMISFGGCSVWHPPLYDTVQFKLYTPPPVESRPLWSISNNNYTLWPSWRWHFGLDYTSTCLVFHIKWRLIVKDDAVVGVQTQI